MPSLRSSLRSSLRWGEVLVTSSFMIFDRLAASLDGRSIALHGSRVLLRPLRPKDFSQWRDVRLANVDWLTKWEPLSYASPDVVANDRAAFDQRCSIRMTDISRDSAYALGVFYKSEEKNNVFIGEMNVSNVLRGPVQSASAGYWIDERFAGQGLIPESLVVLMQFLFDEKALHRLEIPIIPRNRASLRVVEKLQFRKEGLALGFLEINGTFEDHYRFAMLAEEFFERRDELVNEFCIR